MKLLILGASSMQGHKMFQMLGKTFPETYGTIPGKVSAEPLNRIPFFQTDKVIPGVSPMGFQGLENVIRDIRPDWVINCLRVATHGSEVAPPVLNITVNSLLPHRLAEMAAAQGAKLMHFSSDCVFSGKKGFYTEDDTPDATHAYGMSRRLGDVEADNTLVLRGSVIGRELTGHNSLLDWFLMQEGKEIKGFTRAIYSGLSSIETARVVQMVLEKTPALTGLYHVASAPINKYDLLRLAQESFGVDVVIHREEGTSVDRSLNAGKFRAATGYVAPSWKSMMKELADDNGQYDAWGITL
ncbi:MAG: SDR family oxidoreductase [Pontiellaceae bacterium]|jgi:dTDP-4-dehydrorhamnose reductase|nr:SDR family oxidoreductase [Pontiellaceae bacterium]